MNKASPPCRRSKSKENVVMNMYWSYYLKRIFSNKLKLVAALLFFYFPLKDMSYIIRDVKNGGAAIYPFLATFLPGTITNWGQRLLFWYLPLYLLLLVAEDCIEDVKTGYKNILVTKWGKRRYVTHNFIKGFLISFMVLFSSLVLNLLMAEIAFHGGYVLGASGMEVEKIPAMQAAYQSPMLTNCVYILMACFLSGMVGLGAVSISMMLPNRFLAYPIVYFIWYIPSTFKRPIILAIQPFTEFWMSDALPAILFVVGINILAAIAAYLKVMKYDPV